MRPSKFLSHRCRLSIAMLLLVFFAETAFCQERWQALSQDTFQQISSNGHPALGQVNDVVQDRDGFIWLTAGYALLRWDAHQFSPVTINGASGSAAIMPDVFTIKSDPNGEIWVGTARGLYQLDYKSLQLRKPYVDGLNDQAVNLLEFDYKGLHKHVLIGTDRNLFDWNSDTRRTAIYNLPNGSDNRLHALHIDAEQRVLLGTGKGLYVREPGQTKLTEFAALPKMMRIAGLFTDHAKQLWIGTAKEGIFRLDAKHKLSKIVLPESIGDNPWIYCIQEIRPNLLWFGTLGKGIIEFNASTGEVKQIVHNRQVKSSLLDNNIWSLFKDKSGLLWVGTDDGTNIYNPKQTALIHIPGDSDTPTNISDSRIRSILSLPDDTVWLGTHAHGIEIVSPKRGRIRHLEAGQRLGVARVSEDPIESLALDGQGNVLVGSNFNTLQISEDGSTAKEILIKGRAPDAFSAAITHYQGNTWIGGPDGLWRLDKSLNKPATNVFAKIAGDRRVATLLADGETLWVGTWSGVVRINNSSIRAVSDGVLDHQFITALAHDGKKRIWAGTSRAGLFYNTAENISNRSAWRRLTVADGLPDDTIAALQTDVEGNLWVSTGQGIARIDSKTLRIDSIFVNQGAVAAPYSRTSGNRNASGEILFGGVNGLTVINPGKWSPTSYKAPLRTSRISDGQNNILSVSRRPGQPEHFNEQLILPGKNNSFSIEFTALDFQEAERIRYRHRLLGFDEKWIESDSGHRTATYTALPPGTYTIQAQYTANGYDWNAGTFLLPIEIEPRWFQSWWFYVLMVITIVGLAYLSWLARIKIYRNRQLQLEQLVAERTEQLDEAYNELKAKSLEIEQASLTDSLTGLRNRRFLLQYVGADSAAIQRRHEDQCLSPQSNFNNTDLVFFLIDIDHFKTVNDRWGHTSGDKVLVEIRHRLQQVFRDSDYLIRWGGEEFLAVARNSSRHDATELAERLRRMIADVPFTVGENTLHTVTCSIGFVAFPFLPKIPDALTWNETLALADVAMYKAKRDGRNRWVGLECDDIALSVEQITVLKTHADSALSLASLKVLTSNH